FAARTHPHDTLRRPPPPPRTSHIQDVFFIRTQARDPPLLWPSYDAFGSIPVNLLPKNLTRTVAVRPKQHAGAVARPRRRKGIAVFEREPSRNRQLGASGLQLGDVHTGLKIHF